MHCCRDIDDAIRNNLIGFDPGDDLHSRGYTLSMENSGSGDGLCINFCPFCASVLPGALVTDWGKHSECLRCHWTGPPNDAIMPKCICSQGYEELKRIKDEAN